MRARCAYSARLHAPVYASERDEGERWSVGMEAKVDSNESYRFESMCIISQVTIT